MLLNPLIFILHSFLPEHLSKSDLKETRILLKPIPSPSPTIHLYNLTKKEMDTFNPHPLFAHTSSLTLPSGTTADNGQDTVDPTL